MRRVLAMVLVLVFASPTAADPAPPFVHLHSPRLACLGTDCIQLAAGYYFDEPTYKKLDDEMRRLQEAETRLTAENASFKASAAEWQPGWITLVVAVAVGISLGAYIDRHL